MLSETKPQDLCDKIAYCSKQEGALILLKQAIPCILHTENRIGIKIIAMILIFGNSYAINGSLPGTEIMTYQKN